jgi:hypothetical protein
LVKGYFIGAGSAAIVSGVVGLSFPGALAATIGGATVGSAIGVLRGTRRGAETGWNLSEVQLADQIAPWKKLHAVLGDFVAHNDVQYLAFEADKNPGLDQIGFKRKDEYFYIDKAGARTLLSGLDRLFKEGDMPDQDIVAEETLETTDNTNGRVNVELEEVAKLRKEYETQLAELERERSTLRQEMAERREALRRESVEVFLSEMEQPNTEGYMMDKACLGIIRPLLLGDPIELGEDVDAIQLAEDAELSDVHAHYQEAIKALARAIPRVVPTGHRVEAQDKRPESKLAELRGRERAIMLEAKKLAKQAEGIQLTDEVLAEIEKEVDEKLGLTEGGK